MIYVFGIVLILVFLVFFTFTPGGARRNVRENFYGYFYAEDGVTDENDVPNSAEGFEKCAAAGVGIKVNAYHSRDFEIFIAEKIKVDDRLITDFTADELTRKGYMKLADMLNIVNGRVPVVIEIKPTTDNDKNCRLVADIINAYPFANCAVASLHMGTIAWFKHTEKNIFRMSMSAPRSDFAGLPKFDAFMAGNLLDTSAGRPQMIIYRNRKLPALVKFCFLLGASHGTFTITDAETAKDLYEKMDAIFIRGFMPECGRYKELEEIQVTQAEIEQQKKKAEKEARLKREIEIDKRVEEEKIRKKKARGEKVVDKKAAYLYDEEEFGPVDMTYDEEAEKTAETAEKTESREKSE